MAFPGKYDFNYYKGDTLEFKVYPKTTTGQAFSLQGYEASFNIATSRGLPTDQQINAYSQPSPDKSYITCAITPADGSELQPGTTYVYDIEIRNMTATPYPLVYTLLNGNISITDQVTNITEPVVSIPAPVTGLNLTESPAGTLSATWTAPATGSAPTSYKIYGKAPALGAVSYVLVDTVTAPTNTFSISTIVGFPVQANTEYFIKVASVNTAGENTTVVEDSVTTAA
jgi:hypothetical protein